MEVQDAWQYALLWRLPERTAVEVQEAYQSAVMSPDERGGARRVAAKKTWQRRTLPLRASGLPLSQVLLRLLLQSLLSSGLHFSYSLWV